MGYRRCKEKNRGLNEKSKLGMKRDKGIILFAILFNLAGFLMGVATVCNFPDSFTIKETKHDNQSCSSND